ncbi:MAG TPA: FtsX-like permease family protein [Candidatus Sulfobium mesophilum]|nr:FtsX-like permease family protein [Candidatus Sulfobium mesophilum]
MTLTELIKVMVLKNMKREKFLTVLSVIGVALGIGLFTGVKVASDKAISSFEAEIRGTNPYTNFEILDTAGTDFQEEVYRTVRKIAQNSFPVLKVEGYLPEIKSAIDIQGIDLIRTAGFLKLSPGRGSSFENYFRGLNSVIITRAFASSHSLKKGDIVRAFVYDKEFSLRVSDIVDDASLPSNIFLMDLGNFQEHFGKTGYLTRIDAEADETAVSEIKKILPPSVSIGKKEAAIRNQKSLIKSFRYNLQFVSLIAILVGIFLLYNTIFISVVKRRTEIGILRGLGASKKTVVLIFMIQGLILGIAGSMLGILIGQVTAYFSVTAVEKTITSMYRAVSITDYFIPKTDIALALALGFLVSLIASAAPSFEAARIRPNESTREGTFEGGHRRRRRAYALAGLVLIALGCAVSYIDYHSMPYDFPFLAYAGILFIIFGFTLLSPSYLSLVLSGLGRPVEKLFTSVGVITVGDIKGSVYRFSVALMSVAISSALIFALLTLIFSFRNSLKAWINKNIAADVYVKPASCRSNFCFFPLSDELIKTVEGMPEVAGVDRFRTLQIDFQGRKVVAGFGDREIRRRSGDVGLAEEERRAELDFGTDRIIGVSKFLGIKFDLKVGDTVELRTPRGVQKFVVYDIFSSYSTTSGFVYLDRKWLMKYWGLDDATQFAVYLRKGADVPAFISRLNEILRPRFSLSITNNSQLREQVLSIFDRTFAITYAIELISIIVSLIGVINTLLALVIEKKREISILRYLGGSWGQIRGKLVLSAGIVGVTGIFLGGIMGPLMSVIFIEVINKVSFGWEIHFHIPFYYLLIVTAVLFLITLSAGLIPLNVAKGVDPKRLISFE